MLCNIYNLIIVQGDILARTFTFTDQVTGLPINLSIYSAIKMQIRKNVGSPVIATGSLAGGQFAVTGVGNNILALDSVLIPDATPLGRYKYDIEFSGIDIRDTLIRGTITVIEQITTA